MFEGLFERLGYLCFSLSNTDIVMTQPKHRTIKTNDGLDVYIGGEKSYTISQSVLDMRAHFNDVRGNLLERDGQWVLVTKDKEVHQSDNMVTLDNLVEESGLAEDGYLIFDFDEGNEFQCDIF